MASLTSQLGLWTKVVKSGTNDVETLISDKSALQNDLQLLKSQPMGVVCIRGGNCLVNEALQRDNNLLPFPNGF